MLALAHCPCSQLVVSFRARYRKFRSCAAEGASASGIPWPSKNLRSARGFVPPLSINWRASASCCGVNSFPEQRSPSCSCSPPRKIQSVLTGPSGEATQASSSTATVASLIISHCLSNLSEERRFAQFVAPGGKAIAGAQVIVREPAHAARVALLARDLVGQPCRTLVPQAQLRAEIAPLRPAAEEVAQRRSRLATACA